jgi:hypothetical protein
MVAPPTAAAVKIARTTSGSAKTPTSRMRLTPRALYGPPLSSAASRSQKPPAVRTKPPPSMSPMKASGRGKAVRTGISRVTTTGARK